ncbi:hypothetical protein GEMRC1_005923 [Eukaryota sp. GEM-RC1]
MSSRMIHDGRNRFTTLIVRRFRMVYGFNRSWFERMQKNPISSASMVTPCPESLKRSRSSPSSISSVMSNCGELSVLSSSTVSSSKRVHVQQTLLILIHLHLLRRLLKDTLGNNHNRTNLELTALKTALPAFFGQVGYVSSHFLDSSYQAVKVYFQLHTFRADDEDFPKLISLASFFGVDLQSVFLDVYGILEMEKFLNYSGIITGLRIVLMEPSDLEFLNNSSSLIPRLKQLEVSVFQRTSVSMLLIEALKTNTSVTSVNLGYNSIGAEGARALAEALKVNVSVTSVNLSYNSIGAEGVRALAEALKVNVSVTSVNLSYNSIGAEGVRALAEALKVNVSVTSVNLKSNSIGVEGARALAEALKLNASVTSIDLEYNSIGDEGARALAEALKVNASVTSIDLEYNSIGDEGARALAEALKVNASVTSIDLEDNSIGDDGARAFAEALKVNTTVSSINLRDNSLGDEGVRALAETIKVNPRLKIVGVEQLNGS